MGENMNRFIIEDTPFLISKSLCDQHIVKMPLEEAQMLCTALWHIGPNYAEKHNLYKPVHQKHPCTLWAMESNKNYKFAFRLYHNMLEEYTRRYGRIHGAKKHYNSLLNGMDLIPKGQITQHPQCFSGLDELKTDEFYPIKAYRAFYNVDKARFARYKYTERPTWFKEVYYG